MTPRIPILVVLIALLLTFHPAHACCPAPRGSEPAVNADQTIIMLWDPKTKTQHFIRQASFKSQGEDFGFIVPTPSQPQLSESGNEAFALLDKITQPPVVEQSEPISFPLGCSREVARSDAKSAAEVRILEEKRVAGFDAVILEADYAAALKTWLSEHGYAYSPQVETWAAPYIAAHWKFTAMKIAKDKETGALENVAASALRLTFQTDRPLFPYREPDPEAAAKTLSAYSRLLKIYFIADARYQGVLTPETPWTGHTVWANRLSPTDLKSVTSALKLPDAPAPGGTWLTVFEDNWPYRAAPADLYFSPAPTQEIVHPKPIIKWVARGVDTSLLIAVGLFVCVLVIVPVVRSRITRKKPSSSLTSDI